MSDHRLVEILPESFPILRDKFKFDWPKHVVSFTLLSTLSKRQNTESYVNVFCLDGEWENDATFIAKFKTNVSFGTFGVTFDRLKAALKLLDYKEKLKFTCIPEIYSPMFNEVVDELNLKVVSNHSCTMALISKEKAKEMQNEIPENFQLRSLCQENTALVKKLWPHTKDYTHDIISYLIEHNPSVGLFNETNQLLAWCLVYDFGSLAALQVDDNYLRKGYGEIVTRAITKKIAIEWDVDVTTNYINENVKSKNLVEKVGYQKTVRNRWITVCENSE